MTCSGGTPRRVAKIALFIDGEDLHLSAKALGFDLDYQKMLEKFRSRGIILRAIYYIAIAQNQEQQSSIRPLVDWLDYNGFSIISKSTKEHVDAGGRRKVRGNVHIELAVDAMALAEQLDEMVLFSGNREFQPVVKAVQRRGVRVTVVSTIATNPARAADELRRQADCFVDLANLRSDCARHSSDRRTPHHNP
ncbi:NYN domain-containing protein [Bradyrhizobium sp. UFLA05-153]